MWEKTNEKHKKFIIWGRAQKFKAKVGESGLKIFHSPVRFLTKLKKQNGTPFF